MTPEIVPADFPGLASLCWNRNPARAIDREEAWSLYRANWRFVYQDDLPANEVDLIKSLEAEFGGGERLLGTAGPPPPMAGPEITPEQAAEILGIDLVLLERRVKAGVLPFRQAENAIRFSLLHVLERKRIEDEQNKALHEASQIMESLEKPD